MNNDIALINDYSDHQHLSSAAPLSRADIDQIIHYGEIGMSLKETCVLIHRSYDDLIASDIRRYWELGTATGIASAASAIDEHIKNGSLSAARFKLNAKGGWSANVNLNAGAPGMSLTDATLKLVEGITHALRPYPEALKAVLATVETMLAAEEVGQHEQETRRRVPIINI